VPAARSVNRIASVAYATEDMTSLEKTARAFHFGSRSWASSSDDSGRPNSAWRAVARACSSGADGSSAAGLATNTPGAS
jgi:hypothetical protein